MGNAATVNLIKEKLNTKTPLDTHKIRIKKKIPVQN